MNAARIRALAGKEFLEVARSEHPGDRWRVRAAEALLKLGEIDRGLGVLDAARQQRVWGIGVDADQSYLGPQVLTSAEKKVDVAVYTAVGAAMKGRFTGGRDVVFDARNGGVGLGRISPRVPRSIVAQVHAVERKLESGELSNIPDTVK